MVSCWDPRKAVLAYYQKYPRLVSPRTISYGPVTTMSDPVKDQIAQEKFGKNFDELDSMQKVQVGGTKGGQARREQMAEEHGGDVSAGYSEMGHQGGSKGGEARKEQMASEHGGDASAGYREMGQKGGQA